MNNLFKEINEIFEQFKKDADKCIDALKKAQKSSEDVKKYLTKHERPN